MLGKDITQHVDKVLKSTDYKNMPAIRNQTVPEISNSWGRCLTQYNLDPSSKCKPRILTGSALRERQEPLEEFLFIAKSGMKRLYENVSIADYVVLFSDANGVTIDFIGNPNQEKENRDAGLYLGSVWTESIEGTCGVGTCVEEKRAITIHRDEHFRARHIGLSCSATPLFLPDGSLLGVLDISQLHPSESKDSQMLALQMLNYSARMIENAYFLRLYKDSWIIRFNSMKAFVEVLTENMLSVNFEGYIVGANHNALIELSHREWGNPVGRHISDVFDMSFEELTNHAMHKTTTILPIRSIHRGDQYFATFRAPELNAVSLLEKKDKKSKSTKSFTLDYLAGTDPQMIQNVNCAKRVMNKDISILVIGETGTGKEVFAQAVHEASDRASKPFVALNCASIPESLIESELFGYKQGAFTGAHSKGMRGKILQSDGGTLFLDEIGDMPLNLQTRLLRVLAEKEIQPLGSETAVRVDLNVICATLRNLEELVRDGQFREDLYYRLNGITIVLPSLRERKDKGLLIENALAVESGYSNKIKIDADAFGILLAFPWPGNIRQLRNVLRYSIALNDSGTIGVADLPPELTRTVSEAFSKSVVDGNHVAALPISHKSHNDNIERETVSGVLRKHKWNITDAARELGMSRSTLYRKMNKFDLIPPNEL
jgi:sigma-54 dependent transcriptional regulator, acetoin dehydrogenase operon transcriptional activator AcoR